MSQTEQKNPGEVLRATRERMGLSLNDVSVATKINPRILKSLEQGTLEGLPARPFTRGFIRTYATYLKIEADELISAFNLTDDSVPTPAIVSEKSESGGAKKSNVMADSGLKSRALIASGIFVLIVLVVGIKKIVDRYAQERIVETPVNIKGLEVQGETDENDGAVAEENASGADKKEEKAQISEPNAASEESKSTASDTTKPPESKQAETPKPAETKPAEAKPAASTNTAATPAAKPATPATPAQTPAQEVIVEALDEVELTVRIDGGSPRKLALKPESLHTIKARREIVIESDDGGRINVVHNGKDRGVPGDLGKPVRLKYP